MSARSLLRQLVAEAFPWIERFGLTSNKDLEIKSASTKIRMAGPNEKPVHRVDDLGDGGTLSTPSPGILQLMKPDGTPLQLSFTSASPGSPVVIAMVDLSPTPGKIVVRAETGSEKVSSG